MEIIRKASRQVDSSYVQPDGFKCELNICIVY